MATAFPLSTYGGLSDKTRMVDELITMRDALDDGTPRIRVLGGSTYRVIRCVFEHISEQIASDLEQYLITNRATEFSMSIDTASPATTYTGYIWTDPQVSVSNGFLYTVTFDFRGEVS